MINYARLNATWRNDSRFELSGAGSDMEPGLRCGAGFGKSRFSRSCKAHCQIVVRFLFLFPGGGMGKEVV